jgi:nucleoside-diphosphate-sugar epimerase
MRESIDRTPAVKHAFITGAAGFIGGYTVRRFVDEGWHVFALVHRASSPKLVRLAEAGSVTLVSGDIRDPAALRAALASALAERDTALDAIVHCAARVSDVGRRREFRRTNFDAVRDLVELVKDWDIGRLVFISTTDVYGLRDFRGESEDELPLAARPRNHYPEFKIASERLIRAELPPERFAILRPAQVWGVGDPTLTARIVGVMRRSPWIVHFGRWRGRNRWPLAHVRNAALTAFLAATLPEAGGLAVNVVDDERTTLDEFYRILARVYFPRRTFGSVTLPFLLGQVLGAAVSGVSNLLNLERPFADPSFYALYVISHDLDFGNRRLQDLAASAGRALVTRAAGIRELEESAGLPGP